ncbi:MAG: hypothetical protein ACPLXC_02085 [Candidatus Pacearchaeota archaeon]
MIFFISKRTKKAGIFLKEVYKIEDIKKNEQEDYDGVLLKTADVEILRRMIDKAANYFEIYVLGTNDKINRVALEHKKVKALVSPEFGRVFDYTGYRNSGLNQVLCKIARDNNKEIIENFSDFLEKDKKNKAIWLGRVLQNARLCKKYHTKFIVAQFIKSEKEIFEIRKIEDFVRALS